MTIAPAFPCRLSGPQNGFPPAVTSARAKRFPAARNYRRAGVAKVLGMGQNKNGPPGAGNTATALTDNADSGGPRMADNSLYTPMGPILNPEICSSARGVAA
jgi:hypothetical protein